MATNPSQAVSTTDFYAVTPVKRFRNTLRFMEASIHAPKRILDIGVDNPFSGILRERGFDVVNTGGEDLDLDRSAVFNNEYEVATAFEIFEHLMNPLDVMKAVKCDHMFVSVPLRLWFKTAYRNPADEWDQHYHEFEPWQFEWLIKKAGWRIVRSEKWKSAGSIWGIRPFLRHFSYRYYIVELRREN